MRGRKTQNIMKTNKQFSKKRQKNKPIFINNMVLIMKTMI